MDLKHNKFDTVITTHQIILKVICTVNFKVYFSVQKKETCEVVHVIL